jgi:hypothetical protein
VLLLAENAALAVLKLIADCLFALDLFALHLLRCVSLSEDRTLDFWRSGGCCFQAGMAALRKQNDLERLFSGRRGMAVKGRFSAALS